MIRTVLRNCPIRQLHAGLLSSLTATRSSVLSCHIHVTSLRTYERERSRSHDRAAGAGWGQFAVVAAASAVAASAAVWWCSNVQAASQLDDQKCSAGQRREDLPDFSLEQVAQHDSADKRVWMTFGHGVYDVTDFVRRHPGGPNSIMMGAGGAADPFWTLYAVHKQQHVLSLLEQFRVGNLSPQDVDTTSSDVDDLWSDEPRRHPALRAGSNTPFNAEPPPTLLNRSFYTPNELFYVRNHLPVPNVDVAQFVLEVDCSGRGENDCTDDNQSHTDSAHFQLDLSLDQLQRQFPSVSVDAAVMCAGNRRSEMSAVKPVRGLSWRHAAVGNARWTGVPLRDVLLCAAGADVHVTRDGRFSGRLAHVRHVCFEGADTDAGGEPYGASVPIETALSPHADVLLVYQMNGESLSRDHGRPLRLLVPGSVGARSVKWLRRVYLSEDESPSHWQRRDYKPFCPSVDWDTVDFDRSPAIQQLPVNSAFCWPTDGGSVKLSGDGRVACSGYAWSGGGRRVVRVDVSGDGGRTWQEATLSPLADPLPPVGRCWSWTLWSAEVSVPSHASDTQLCVKAVDDSCNTQPENFDGIWNLRGVLANAYHRVNVHLRRPVK